MASSARIDELKKKFDENPRRYFAPLANEFRKGGDLEQAILICEEFLPHQPGHMSGHIVYGQALFESGRPDDARAVFETALSLDPENLIALRHLGDIAGQRGDTTEARRWYERVLEADPRNEEIQSLIAGLDGAPPARRIEEERPAAVAQYDQPPAATPVAAPQASSYDGPMDLEPIDLDETIPHGVPLVTPQQSTEAQHAGLEDDLGLGGIVPMPDTEQLMPEVADRADGFESTEFSPPESPILPTAGLESAFEEETGIYGAAVQPLEGLDSPHANEAASHEADASTFPELEGDHGLVLPPHGDPVAPTAAAPASPANDFATLDGAFEMPGEQPHSIAPDSAPAASEATAASEAAESMELMDFELPSTNEVPDAAPAGSALPLELPPEVIAAEAELVDAGVSLESADIATDAELDLVSDQGVASSGDLPFIDTSEEADEPAATTGHSGDQLDDDHEPEAPSAHTPFVTETMAELYVSQGLNGQALAVYEQLSAARPDDSRLAERVASLRASAVAAPAAPGSGPTVREFLSRLAARRPGVAAASAAPPEDDDFATSEPAAASEDVQPSQHEAPLPAAESTSPAHSPTAARPSGSIDALFGNQPSGESVNSAASALAQAFGSEPSAPPITGNPARQAAGELSLDSVFRDGPARAARTSQGFSFDQFFSQNPEGETTGGTAPTSQDLPAEGEPAEKSSDDIEQFNSWLQGLKNR
jgi:tetratricopeptide (TPR) repeat protein